MNEFVIEGSGASGTLISDFNTVKESCGKTGKPKYPLTPIMNWLAKVIIGHGGGANKDTPLYELCNLIYALNCLNSDKILAGQRKVFFLGPEPAQASHYKNYFSSYLTSSSKEHVTVKATSIEIQYKDDVFEVSYQRMAFLSSLFEFLLTMKNFAHWEILDTLFDTLIPAETSNEAAEMRLIKDASNKVSSIFRTYRRENLPISLTDARFGKMFKFIQQRSPQKSVTVDTVDDDTIFAFWQEHSFLEEYRVYKTVFDSFIDLDKTLNKAALQKTIAQARQLGTDKENNEIEPDDKVSSITDLTEWQSPFNIMDLEPISSIKFFKYKGERQPIEQLMHYGPYATKFPLAFLRMEAFGTIQNGISNDLRLSKGIQKIEERITCETAQNYLEITNGYQRILDHIKDLQMASLHVIYANAQDIINEGHHNAENKVVALFDQTLLSKFEQARENKPSLDLDRNELRDIMEASAQAFKSFNRSGFTEEFTNKPDNVEAFQLASGALVQMESILNSFLRTPIVCKLREAASPDVFNSDKSLFSKQFRTIYGAEE